MFDRKLFGERLRLYRNERGMSLNELAELADISFTYLSNLESGKHTPTTDVIFSLLDALNLNYEMLMGDTNNDAALTKAIINNLKVLNDKEIEFMTRILAVLKKRRNLEEANGVQQ